MSKPVSIDELDKVFGGASKGAPLEIREDNNKSTIAELDAAFGDPSAKEVTTNVPNDPQVSREQRRQEYNIAKNDPNIGGHQYQPRSPEETDAIEESWADIATAGGRGFTHGVTVMADLLPTMANWLGETVTDVVTGQPIGTTDYDDYIKPWALSDLADNQLGTVDSHIKGPMTEVAANVGEAVPVIFSMGAGLQRYGLAHLQKTGTVNRLVADYTLKRNTMLGVDTALTFAGETAEEIVEEVAGEDSLWGTAANVGTSIFGAWRLNQSKLGDAMGISDEALRAKAGTAPIEKAKGAVNTVLETADAVTKPVQTTKNAWKAMDIQTGPEAIARIGGTLTGVNPVLWAAGKATGKNLSPYHFLKEKRVLDMTAKDTAEAAIRNMPAEAVDRYKANVRIMQDLGLDLDTYELTGNEAFKGFSRSVAHLDPNTALQRHQKNIRILDDYLDENNLKYNRASRDNLMQALVKHNVDVEAQVVNMRNQAIRQNDKLIRDLDTKDVVEIGDEFKEAYKAYERSIKDLVGKGYDKAMPKDLMVSSAYLRKHAVSQLKSLEQEGLLSGATTLPKLIGQMIGDLGGETIGMVKKYPKIQVKDIHLGITDLKKAMARLSKDNPNYHQQSKQFLTAIDAMEHGLAKHLGPEDYEKYLQAKTTYRDVIGAKKNPEEVRKFTYKDQYNNIKANGEDLIRELLNPATNSNQTRIDRISKLLTISDNDVKKFNELLGEELDMDPLLQAQETMQLKIKDYITKDFLGKLNSNPNRSVQELADEYMTQHGRAIHAVLNEPLDLMKMGREVDIVNKNMQKKVENKMAEALDIKAKANGNFSLKGYVNNTLLGNKKEMDRFVAFLDNKEKLKELGFTRGEMRDAVAGEIVKSTVNFADAHSMTSSLDKLLKNEGSALEKVLGKKRYEHLQKFSQAHQAATRLKESDIKGPLPDLERKVFGNKLSWIPSAVSRHYAVQRGVISPAYAMALGGVNMLGGLKNNSYKEFMTKAMLDPEFFEGMAGVAKAKNVQEDDIIRMRINLARFGITTDVKDNKEAEETSTNFVNSAIALEDSQYIDAQDVEREEQELMAPEVTEEAPVEEPPVAPAEPVEPTVTEPTGVEQEAPAVTNVPEIPPSDPTSAVSTRKSMKEIRDGTG